MLKDTKSLGNNKAPACESRGFVLKKEGVLFDTPSFLFSIRMHAEFFFSPQARMTRKDTGKAVPENNIYRMSFF